MFGKLLGAAAGAEASKFSRAFDGTTGAVMGALAVPLVRRLSLPALVVLGAGGYFAKRYMDKREAENSTTQGRNRARPARKASRKTAAASA
ncbi:MAG: hypothetical protein ABIT10_04185 [Alteraurantiacibacter sp.]